MRALLACGLLLAGILVLWLMGGPPEVPPGQVVTTSPGSTRHHDQLTQSAGGGERPSSADRSKADTEQRHVRLRGRFVLVEPAAHTFGRRGPGPGFIDPRTNGMTDGTIFQSIGVKVANDDGVKVDALGRFLLETEVPARDRSITLAIESNLVVPRSGRPRVRVKLDEGNPIDQDVVINVVPAHVAQPRYNGKVITPRDLADPVIRESFMRQMADSLAGVVPPQLPPS